MQEFFEEPQENSDNQLTTDLVSNFQELIKIYFLSKSTELQDLIKTNEISLNNQQLTIKDFLKNTNTEKIKHYSLEVYSLLKNEKLQEFLKIREAHFNKNKSHYFVFINCLENLLQEIKDSEKRQNKPLSPKNKEEMSSFLSKKNSLESEYPDEQKIPPADLSLSNRKK